MIVAGAGFPKLERVNFGFSQYALRFRFVPAQKAVQMNEANLNGRYISFLDVPNITVNLPDGIRFSNLTQAIIIQKFSQNFKMYQVPFHDKLESRWYQIPATEAKVFFQSIRRVLCWDKYEYVPSVAFENTLRELKEKQYITESDAEEYKRQIKSTPDHDEYADEVEKTKNVKKALSLALYWKSPSSTLSLHWLARAKTYAGDKKLSTFIDLNGFFRKREWIVNIEIFCLQDEEILAAAVGSPSIKYLYTHDLASDDLDTIQRIGRFLEKSKSIETVSPTPHPFMDDCDRLTETTSLPIINALRINKSILCIDLSHSKIGDKGTIKLVQAIENNPESKITCLCLDDCGMTDIGARKVLRLAKKRQQITAVYLSRKNNISESLLAEIQELFALRKKMTA